MTDPDPRAWNRGIIEEFRANAGKVGGPFEGAPMILIHHKGAKTGTEHVNQLVYQAVGQDFAIFASKGGAPTDPQWFRNLVAHPEITVEVGTDTFPVTARILEGSERERVWTRQKEMMPGFGEYEQKTQGIRDIPVILLERAA
jgi:deazaflavin-dependent oxidoreductase (nitroreductase family)